MKSKFLFSVLGLLFCVGGTSLQAATVVRDGTCAVVDFGWDISGGTNPVYGNRIGGASNDQSISDLISLGAGATGWTLRVTGFRAAGSTATNFATTLWTAQSSKFNDFSQSLGLMGPLAEEVWRDCAAVASSGAGTTMELTNLQANKEYTISLGIGRNAGSASSAISLTKGTLESGSWFNSAGGSAETALSTITYDSKQTIATYKVMSNELGQISFNFSNASYGGLNFMVITVPEPSTASLGLLGLTGILLRRRRLD